MSNLALKNNWRSFAVALGLAALVVAAWRVSSLFPAMIEVDISDEIFYIDRAIDFLRGRTLSLLDWGPLYSVWYSLLLHIKSDPLDVYFLNMRALFFLVPLLAYFYFIRRGHTPLFSLGMALFLMFMDGNVYFNRRPNHFCLLLILLMLHLQAFSQSSARRANIACFFALILSYVRPEFFLAYLLTSCWLFFLIARQNLINPLDTDFVVESSLFLVASGFVFYLAGDLPIDLSASGKALHSFKDYVYFSYKGLHPASQLNLQQVFQKLFPGVKTFTGAVLANPSYVLNHLSYNLKNLAPQLWAMVSAHSLMGQATVLVLIFTFFLVWGRRWRDHFRHKDGLIIFFMVPSLCSMTLYGVLDRYVYALVVMILLLLSPLARPKQPPRKGIQLGMCILLFFAAIFWPLEGIPSKKGPIFHGGEHLKVLRFLRQLKPAHMDQRILLFVKEGFPHTYLGKDWQTYNLFNYFQSAAPEFSTVKMFLTKNLVDIIWVDQQMIWSTANAVAPHFRAEFSHLFERPHEWGYRKVLVPQTQSFLLVRAGLELKESL